MNQAMRDAGRQSGVDFGNAFATGFERQSPRIQSAMIKAADATRRVREETEKFNRAVASGDMDKATAASNRLTAAHRSNDSALRNLAQVQALVSNGAETLAATATQAGASLGNAAGPAGVGALVVALGALISITSAASGALGLLPGVALAAGAGIGTLALGTQDFGDALKNLGDPAKFADSLQQLSPNARQAALDIRSLVPAFDELKASTQQTLFQGVGPQLQQLSATLMPQVEQMTTGIAAAFNDMFSTTIANPTTLGAIQTTFTNITTTFQQLGPAVDPFVQALSQIASVGSGVMPEIANAASQAATSFAQFIDQASRSGELDEWIRRGVDTLGQMLDVIGNLPELFFELGGTGASAMDTISSGVQTTTDVLKVLSGDVDTLTNDLFPSFGESVVNTFNNLGSVIDAALLSPLRALIDLLNKIPGIKLPSIPELTKFNPDGSVDNGSWGGGGGSFGGPGTPPGARPGGLPGTPGIGSPAAERWSAADQAAHPTNRNGLPQGAFRKRDGSIGFAAPPSLQQGIPTPLAGPYGPTATGGAGGTAPAPQTPFSGDPMSLLGGLPVTSSNYSAASAVLQSRHDVEQQRALVDQLELGNVATQDEITKAKNDLAEKQQKQFEAELRLNEQRATATDKYVSQMGSAADSLTKLDSDFGISKGLPGIVDNITRALGNLATAGFRGQLKAIEASDPNWQARLAAQNGVTTGSGYSPFGVQSGSGSNVDAMMALAQGSSGHVKYAAASDMVSGLADCSGSISDLVETLRDGKPNSGRLFDTTAFTSDAQAAQQGFLPGYMPGAFNVGVNPYPGQSGHMAATLPNGVNFEGGGGTGGGAQYGGSASGALDPQFQKQYYMPLPDMGAPVSPPVGQQPTQTGWGAGGLPAMGGGGQGFGAGLTPGMAGQAAGAPVAPVGTPAPGGWQPAATSNQGLGSMAGSAAAMMFPGAGEAAAKAGQLIDRGVKFGGQLAGIGISGLQETFGLSDPSGGGGLQSGWIGRLASGLAQVKPAAPTTAGQTKAPAAEPQKHEGSGAPPGPQGPTVHIENVNQQQGQSAQEMAKEVAFRSYAAKGSP
jgi:hypothetical protein